MKLVSDRTGVGLFRIEATHLAALEKQEPKGTECAHLAFRWGIPIRYDPVRHLNHGIPCLVWIDTPFPRH